MKKKTIAISALMLIVLVSCFAPSWAAGPSNANSAGATGGCTTCRIPSVKGVQPTAGDICVKFVHEGHTFVLTVNKGSPSHTGGDWCQDFAPTGTVTGIGSLYTKFDLTGTKTSSTCCDTIHIWGTILAIGPFVRVTISWNYPSSDCNSQTYTYSGKATRC